MASHVVELANQKGLLGPDVDPESVTAIQLQSRLQPQLVSELFEQVRQRDEVTLRLLLTQNLINAEDVEALKPASVEDPERPSVFWQACQRKAFAQDDLLRLFNQTLFVVTDEHSSSQLFQSLSVSRRGGGEQVDHEMTLIQPNANPDAQATMMTPPPNGGQSDTFDAPTIMTPPPVQLSESVGAAGLAADNERTLPLQSHNSSSASGTNSDTNFDPDSPTLVDDSRDPDNEATLLEQTDPRMPPPGISSPGSAEFMQSAVGPVMQSQESSPSFGSQPSGSGFGSSPGSQSGPGAGSQSGGASSNPSSQMVKGSWLRASQSGSQSSLLNNVEALIDTEIAGWKFHSLLGKGAMGAVYRATNQTSSQEAAVKVILPGLKNALDYLPRFRQEAEVLAKLNHPNIVGFLEFEEDPIPYLALEFVPSQDLKAMLRKRRRLPIDECLQLAKPVLAALEYAHGRGIIHRDLKPENILITEAGEPKISDFGLGRDANDQDDVRLTLTGRAMGTPYYMPPEQIDDAKSAEARSDLYSFGAMLFRMVTGQPPFTGTQAQILTAHYQKAPPKLRAWNPKAPAALENLVLELMSKSVDDRPATARDVLDRIQEIELEWHAQSSASSIGQKMSLDVGTSVNGWALDKVLGAGGMGKVFRGKKDEQTAAIKILAPTITSDPKAVQRFEREVEVTKKLEHPNIVEVFDAGVAQVEGISYPYMAMEFVGSDFAKILDETGPLPAKQAVEVAIGAGRALAYSAGHEVIHRDVKPENILLANKEISIDNIRVTDFGVAALTNQASNLTQTTAAVGSPHYMAPEQAKGSQAIDARVDVYSLGATLYHLLTGRRLFTADNIQGLLIAHASELPLRADEVLNKVPEDLAWLVDYAVLKIPEDRPDSMATFVEDLEAWYQGNLSRDRLAQVKSLVKKGRRPFEPRRNMTPYLIVSVIILALSFVAFSYYYSQAGTRVENPYIELQSKYGEVQSAIKTLEENAQKDETQINNSILSLKAISRDLQAKANDSKFAEFQVPPNLSGAITDSLKQLYALELDRLRAGVTELRAMPDGISSTTSSSKIGNWLESQVREAALVQADVSAFSKRVPKLVADLKRPLGEKAAEDYQRKILAELASMKAEVDIWKQIRSVFQAASPYWDLVAQKKLTDAASLLADKSSNIKSQVQGLKYPIESGESGKVVTHPICKVLQDKLVQAEEAQARITSDWNGRLTKWSETIESSRDSADQADIIEKVKTEVQAFIQELGEGNASFRSRAEELLKTEDPRVISGRKLQAQLTAKIAQQPKDYKTHIDSLTNLIKEYKEFVDVSASEKTLEQLKVSRDAAAEKDFEALLKRQAQQQAQELMSPEKFVEHRQEIERFPENPQLLGWSQLSKRSKEALASLSETRRRYVSDLVTQTVSEFNKGSGDVGRAKVLSWIKRQQAAAQLALQYQLTPDLKELVLRLQGDLAYLEGLHQKAMVLIEPGAGTAEIGNNDPYFAHSPKHSEPVTSFYVDKFEVSVASYQHYVESRAKLGGVNQQSLLPPDWTEQLKQPNWPVRNLSFAEVQAFAKWAGKAIPTEVQWETAARRSGGPYAWGSDIPEPNLAVFSAEQPDSVDSHLDGSTPDAVLNMSGNVAEWTESKLEPYPGANPDSLRALPLKQAQVVRGGSYLSLRSGLKVWMRDFLRPEKRAPSVGFRCVCKP